MANAAMVGALLLGLSAGVLSTEVVAAPVSASTTPSPSPRVGEVTADTGFAITSPDNDFFVRGTKVTLSGKKRVGAAVTIPAVLPGGEALCATRANDKLTWECTDVALPSGSVALKALQHYGSDDPIESEAVLLRVLGAPAIRGDGAIVSAGAIDGFGWDGASIRVNVESPRRTIPCSQPVADGFWYCALDLPSGTYDVKVEQSWPGSTTDWSPQSAGRQITIDTDIPLAPVITSPQSGEEISSQPFAYSGSAENGTTVDVYAGDQYLCSDNAVVRGAWSCEGAGAIEGPRQLIAIQYDAAFNYSPPSAAVAVTYSTAAAAPSGETTPAPSAANPPASSRPPLTPAPEQAPVAPAPATPLPTPPNEPPAASAPFTGEGSSAAQTWGRPTNYGAGIASPRQSLESGSWIFGVIFALGWLLLIALPLRLLASTLRGRENSGHLKLTGRNRLGPRVEQTAPTDRRIVGGGALAAAALLAVLASGIEGEVRYLRLTLAVALGIAVINLGVVLSTRWMGRSVGVSRSIRLVPLFLAIGAGTALVSRLAGIEPPLVIGVVVGVTFGAGVAARARGAVQLVQLATLLGLSTVAWVALGVIGPASGFLMTAITETLSAICLAGLGSLMLLMLPVMSLPGRAILEWSPSIWLAMTLLVGTFTAIIITGEQLPVLVIAGGAAIVAIICFATWAWVRFVEPATPR